MRLLAFPFLTLCLLLATQNETYASCAQFEAEAEAVSGVVPKFDENGKLRAIVTYGEATFLTPKRSLISSARQKAELNAKKAFSAWMEESLSSESVVADMVETAQATNQDGETVGYAKELETQVNVMRSNTSAVLSGLVKLDECVDTEQKYILVELGWKPSLSSSAANAKKAMTAPPSQKATTASSGQATSSNVNTANREVASNSSKKGGVNIIVVEVEGYGTDLKRATNEALRSAIAQVFGEKFASSQRTVDLVQTLEATTSSGASAGVAVESSASLSDTKSETAGLIKSYSYISKGDTPQGFRVELSVSLPKYESTIDANKNTVIVLMPKLSGAIEAPQDVTQSVAGAFRDAMETRLNAAKSLTVLDRRFLGDQQRELNYLASGASPVSELARAGNAAGADFMLITEIFSLSSRTDERVVGGTTVKREIINSEIGIKLIEVASTNVLYTKRFPFKNIKVKTEAFATSFAETVAKRVAGGVVSKVGGGYAAGEIDNGDDTQNVKNAESRADERMKKLKESTQNDW